MSGDTISGYLNSCKTGPKETLIKKNNGTTLLPFFPDLWAGNFEVQPNHEDQILTLEDLKDSGILSKNILTFRDAVKHRFYSVCELTKIEE
jgi:hypothetical protein